MGCNMTKEAYYFSHDANARQDEKILMLRAEHGWEGYGIYWALIEMMFESSDSVLNHSKIKGIAVSYNIDITLLQSVINTCITEELFNSDNEHFWSESLLRRKTKFLDSKAQKSEAGSKGMAKRWGNRQPTDNGVNNGVITENNKVKERKVKESKGKEIKESELTHSTEADYKKVSKAYAEIHKVLELPYTNGPLLSKLLDEGIPPDHIIGVMKEKFREGVKTLKFYEGAIRDSWNTSTTYEGLKIVRSSKVNDILRRFAASE